MATDKKKSDVTSESEEIFSERRSVMNPDDGEIDTENHKLNEGTNSEMKHVKHDNDEDDEVGTETERLPGTHLTKNVKPETSEYRPLQHTPPSHHTFNSVRSTGESLNKNGLPHQKAQIPKSPDLTLEDRLLRDQETARTNTTFQDTKDNLLSAKPSRLGPVSRANNGYYSSLSKNSSNYYHGDIADENLRLSASRIDSTLLHLFSTKRDENAANGGVAEDKLLPYLNYSESDLISMDAVLWRVKPMEASQKGALEQEMTFLEENIRPKELLGRLYMEEVLTHMDYNTIMRTEGQGERAVTRLLIRTLMRRGDKAYPSLIQALDALDYTNVTQRLKDTESILRMAIEREGMNSKQVSFSPATSHDILYSIRTPAFFPPSKRHRNTFGKAEDVNLSPIPDSSDDSPSAADIVRPSSQSVQNPASGRESAVINSHKLEEQLNGLSLELRALHEDVTALKTSRANSHASGRVTANPNMADRKEAVAPQKSGSCTVL